jgi:hypothetical protein
LSRVKADAKSAPNKKLTQIANPWETILDFFKRYFGSRRPTAVTIRRRNTGGNGPRLRLEALEERTLLNNRFVVPVALADNVSKFADLQAALIQPGLSAGDIIQIEPSSAPGGIINANLPAVQNLTIQGDPAFDVQAIPSFAVNDAVSITSAQQGFTLKNVQVSLNGGGLLFNADGNIVGARIADFFAGDAIDLTDTSAAVISNSYRRHRVVGGCQLKLPIQCVRIAEAVNRW